MLVMKLVLLMLKVVIGGLLGLGMCTDQLDEFKAGASCI